LIYTRHFRGYDAGIGNSFERLRNWAQPRDLIGSRTVFIGIGLDNPRVTSSENCRFLAGFTSEKETELGSGIGTRLIPAGLYAVVEFSGFWSELHMVFSKLFYFWLPQSGVEAISPCTYLENLAIPLDLRSLHCRIALQVRSV
jgi:DNA gyrase inhibitor GyrI